MSLESSWVTRRRWGFVRGMRDWKARVRGELGVVGYSRYRNLQWVLGLVITMWSFWVLAILYSFLWASIQIISVY